MNMHHWRFSEITIKIIKIIKLSSNEKNIFFNRYFLTVSNFTLFAQQKSVTVFKGNGKPRVTCIINTRTGESAGIYHIHVFNMQTWKPGIAPQTGDIQVFSFNGYEAIILLKKIVESESWEKDWKNLFTVGEKYEPFIVGKNYLGWKAHYTHETKTSYIPEGYATHKTKVWQEVLATIEKDWRETRRIEFIRAITREMIENGSDTTEEEVLQYFEDKYSKEGEE